MKLITVDVKKETFDVAAVEGSSNSIQIHFKNTPDEWRDDSVGVFVLFAKGDKSQMFPINKETMTTDVLNNMLSVNTGFKVTVFAMNSDTENPYKYVIPPIWVEVRQGYECDVSSAPDRDNMDAICTLIQVLMSYDEAEAERKANEEEREKKIADFDAEFKEYKNTIHNGEEVYDADSSLSQSGKAVAQAVASIVNSAPETLNTLEELATALGNDPNFATTIMTLLGGKVDTGIFNRIIEELQEDILIHKSNQLNPHFVTKEQIGLGNVDNTSDKDKPISDAVKEELGNKVDKVDGKVLSTNDFTNEDKQKLTDTRSDMDTMIGEITIAQEKIDNKVDKVEAFGLTLMEPTIDEEDSGYSWDKVYFENKPYIPGEDVTRSVEVYSVDGADKKFVEKVDGKGLSSIDFNIEWAEKVDNAYWGYEYIAKPPLTEISSTLATDYEYILGEVESLSLTFPTVANDGDVIYLTFYSGATPTTLAIDTTNTSDIEVVPEANTGYEIFGKFNGSIWIVNYSEYTVSEG
jgi:hypothetical protein